ncbi:RNA polymerase II mediator complex subunit [Elasticomyces elasticus]|nr:RNA polymerase II mediator complex subunit [Elasticomyces elasticus]
MPPKRKSGAASANESSNVDPLKPKPPHELLPSRPYDAFFQSFISKEKYKTSFEQNSWVAEHGVNNFQVNIEHWRPQIAHANKSNAQVAKRLSVAQKKVDAGRDKQLLEDRAVFLTLRGSVLRGSHPSQNVGKLVSRGQLESSELSPQDPVATPQTGHQRTTSTPWLALAYTSAAEAATNQQTDNTVSGRRSAIGNLEHLQSELNPVENHASPIFSPITPGLPLLDSNPSSVVHSSEPNTPRESFEEALPIVQPVHFSTVPILEEGPSMAVQPADETGVDNAIKNVIQDLFTIQQHVHTPIPAPEGALPEQFHNLSRDLAKLSDLSSTTVSPDNPIHNIRIAPDIIDYVDDGRNPDIYTRDFVELVQRGNAVVNGKQQAFKSFSQILADALKDGLEDDVAFGRQVDLIMSEAGNVKKNGKWAEVAISQQEEPKKHLINGI